MDMIGYFVVLLALVTFISGHPLEKVQEERHRVVVRTLYVPLYKGTSSISSSARKAVKSSIISTEPSQDYDAVKPATQNNGRQHSYYNIQLNSHQSNSVYDQNNDKNHLQADKSDYYVDSLQKPQSYSQQVSSDSYRQQPQEQSYTSFSNKLVFPSPHVSVKQSVHQEELSADPNLQYGSGRTVSSQGKNEYISSAPRSPADMLGTWPSFLSQPQSTSTSQNTFSSPNDAYGGSSSVQSTYQVQQKAQSYQPSAVTSQFYTPQTNHQIYQHSTAHPQASGPSYQNAVPSYHQQNDILNQQRVVQQQTNVQQSNSDQYRQQQQQQSNLPVEHGYTSPALSDASPQSVTVLTHPHSSELQSQNIQNAPLASISSPLAHIQAHHSPSITATQIPSVGQTTTQSYHVLSAQQPQGTIPLSPQTAYPLPQTAYQLPQTAYPLPQTAHPLPQTAYPLNSNPYSPHLSARVVGSHQIHQSNNGYSVSFNPQQNPYSNSESQFGMPAQPPIQAVENMSYTDQTTVQELQQSSANYGSSYAQQVQTQQPSYGNLPQQNTQLLLFTKPNSANQQPSEPSSQQVMPQYSNFPSLNQDAGVLGPPKFPFQNAQLQNSHTNHNSYQEYNPNAHRDSFQSVSNPTPNNKPTFHDPSLETYHSNPRQVYMPPLGNYQAPMHSQQQLQASAHVTRPYDRDIFHTQPLKKMFGAAQDGVLVHRLLAPNSNQLQPIHTHQGFQGFASNRMPSPHLEISLPHPQTTGYNSYRIIY